MAYGAIGAILGHEMSHGFDNTGRQFDKYGEMNDWWTKSSKEKFNNRTKCMVDQYNEYKVAGGHHVSHLILFVFIMFFYEGCTTFCFNPY